MFLGREEELESLRLLLDKPTLSLVACRGRRRIGKSTLLREFARRNKLELIVIEGLGPHKGQTNADQLHNFGERLCAQAKGAQVFPDSWMSAFTLPGKRIDRRKKTVRQGRAASRPADSNPAHGHSRRGEEPLQDRRRHRIGDQGEAPPLPKRRAISLRTALVYDGELAPGVVQSGVFDLTIPFSNLLRLHSYG